MSDPEILPSTTSFPLSKERVDVYAMNYPYQVNARDRSNPSQIDKMNYCFSKLRFNENNYLHRPGCFKKGS